MSDGVDWSNLPGLILPEIFSKLPVNDRLLASQTCKAWRDGLFSPALWRHQHYYLNNQNTVSKMQFLCDNGCALYAKCLKIIWPQISNGSRAKQEELEVVVRGQLAAFFSSIAGTPNLERFVLIIEKRKPCYECLDMFSTQKRQVEIIRDGISEVLRSSPRLTHINLGCSPKKYKPTDVVSLLQDKSLKKLTELHISSADDCDITQGVTLDCLSTGAKIDRLINLEHLSIDWHSVTPAFLRAFNARSDHKHLKKLNVFVAEHHCSQETDNHPDRLAWKEFNSNNKDVVISLVFVNQVGGVCSELQHISPVFQMKFLECDSICEVAYEKVIRWHQDTIESHVMCSTSSCLTELDNGHILWMYMRACRLKYITVIGYFVFDEIVKLIASEFAPNLEVLHIPKNQILTSAEASYFMVPISGSKVRELSQSMETILKRPWRPLRKHPLAENYFSDASDDNFYLKPAPIDMLF